MKDQEKGPLYGPFQVNYELAYRAMEEADAVEGIPEYARETAVSRKLVTYTVLVGILPAFCREEINLLDYAGELIYCTKEDIAVAISQSVGPFPSELRGIVTKMDNTANYYLPNFTPEWIKEIQHDRYQRLRGILAASRIGDLRKQFQARGDISTSIDLVTIYRYRQILFEPHTLSHDELFHFATS